MRAEEKELEGPDLEREQRVEQAHRETAEEEEELTEVIGAEVRDVALDHRSRLFDALQLILANEQVNISLLYLPRRETLALEALQEAVTGADSMGEFVFAEDRRILLEQALAVLQQNLTHGDPAQLAALQTKYDALTGQVGELRDALVDLEDAQEEIDEFHNAARERHGEAGDKDDDDKPKPDAGLGDYLADALAPRPSTLYGPEVKEPPKLPTTLDGPEIRVTPKGPSSLSHGPEVTEPPAPVSTLEGPEIAIAPRPPSTLGDPLEIGVTDTLDPSPQRRKIKPQEPPKKGPR